MVEHVNLYIGSSTDLSDSGEKIFERAKLLNTEPTTSPANLKEHYNVKVTVKSKETEIKYTTEIDSRTINNWFSRFETIIEDELRSNSGIKAEYSEPKERNPTIIELLSKLVPFWINTKDSKRV